MPTDITFDTGAATLAGTLTMPAGAGPHPVGLLIAGSGPLDRHGNYKQKMMLDISRQLADHLASIGWGSLRFDKRGVGESTGEYLPTGFFDELADVEAAMGWLEARDDVSALVPIGHSAGAVQAGRLAASRPNLAGAVLLSTSAKIGRDTMRWQNEQMEDVLLPAPIRRLMKLFGTSLVKQSTKAMKKLERSTDAVVRMQLVAKVNAKWMREFLTHDPRPDLAAANVPLLAITGEKDIQVDPDDVATLLELAPDAEGHVVTDVDHILRHETAEISNPRKYRSRAKQPLDPRVVALVLDWLERLDLVVGLGPTPDS